MEKWFLNTKNNAWFIFDSLGRRIAKVVGQPDRAKNAALIAAAPELAAALVEVNEFCQLRGIGKVGDSASAALMQRHDELAAQVERLRDVLKNLQSTVEYADNGEGCYIAGGDLMIAIDRIASETPPAALTALKAQWQADILAEISLQVSASKPEATPIQIATAIFTESKRIRQRAREAGNANTDNQTAQ